MSKTLHSRHNKIFLKKLRDLRESRTLRQSDLADLLGCSQGTVSNVERGETRLDVIELRDWLDALNYGFIRFLRELNADLRRLNTLRFRCMPPKRPRPNRSSLPPVMRPTLPQAGPSRRASKASKR